MLEAKLDKRCEIYVLKSISHYREELDKEGEIVFLGQRTILLRHLSTPPVFSIDATKPSKFF